MKRRKIWLALGVLLVLLLAGILGRHSLYCLYRDISLGWAERTPA